MISGNLKKIKLRSLLKIWKPGMLATSDWLKSQGISQQLSYFYVQYDWIEKIAAGVFKRSSDHITWSSAVYALQKLKKLPIHVGGLSAIELHGRSHFIRNQRAITLFGDVLMLPAWCNKIDFDGTKLVYTKASPWKSGFLEAITEYSKDSFEIQVSNLERAIMEFLSGVPQHHTYEEAAHLMEALPSLRPIVVQSLLEKCRSVKVKRLFLHLATACQHSWVLKLDRSSIDLGKGIRQIRSKGYLDKQHLIYVPTEPLGDTYVKDLL